MILVTSTNFVKVDDITVNYERSPLILTEFSQVYKRNKQIPGRRMGGGVSALVLAMIQISQKLTVQQAAIIATIEQRITTGDNLIILKILLRSRLIPRF